MRAAMSSEAYYASFDPGATTGWVLWTEDCVIIDKGQATFEELIDLLEEDRFKTVKVIIYENFKLFKWKAQQQSGSTMPASQAIGMILSFAHRRGASLVDQPSNILPIAEKLTQVKMPGNHAKSHWVSAFLHGAYYLIKQGIYVTPLAESVKIEKN
jgi:hypothetical protein